MSAGPAVATAAIFIWLGMVLAISFLEAPLKFRARGVTLEIGLGIGRLVFRALNSVEAVLGAVVLSTVASSTAPGRTVVATATAVVLLAVQLVVVRPRLTRRSDRILAGDAVPRSRAHAAFVAVETLKVLALATAGTLLLTG
jgi:predicted membrane-bound spermidine synthase